MEESGRLQSMGSLRVTTEWLHFHFSLSYIGEGNGNPLQCSCLENPRDGKPGGLLSMGSHRVRHDWSDLAADLAAVRYEWWSHISCLKWGMPSFLTFDSSCTDMKYSFIEGLYNATIVHILTLVTVCTWDCHIALAGFNCTQYLKHYEL